MGTYEVLIFPTAKQDLADIVCYLNTLSPDAAFRYYDELVENSVPKSLTPFWTMWECIKGKPQRTTFP